MTNDQCCGEREATGRRSRSTTRYARLPDRFFARLAPTPVAAPAAHQAQRGAGARTRPRSGALTTPEGVAVLAGNRVPEGAEPLAQAYAGHQFGNFVPQLGRWPRDPARRGRRQRPACGATSSSKGSGPTPFSRRGDGRAALGPVLREYIVSEAFAALGIPATRSLAAVATGEAVARETMLPGAVLTRIAASHVRVGTFQYFAARQDWEAHRASLSTT